MRKKYFEIKDIKNNDIKEINFKDEYTVDNPIILHFYTPNNNLKYLSYQIVQKISNEILSFYVYKNNLDNVNIIEKIENTRGKEYIYIKIENNKDYYIKTIITVMKGEIELVLRFMKSENDEYFNEFTIKLDSINLKKFYF